MIIGASGGSAPEWFDTSSAPPSAGHVLDALLLDPEPVAVVEVEQRLHEVEDALASVPSRRARGRARAQGSARAARAGRARRSSTGSGRGSSRSSPRGSNSGCGARGLSAPAPTVSGPPSSGLSSARCAAGGRPPAAGLVRDDTAADSRPVGGYAAQRRTTSVPRRTLKRTCSTRVAAVVAPGAPRQPAPSQPHAARAERTAQRGHRGLQAERVAPLRARARATTCGGARPTARARPCRGRRASCRAGTPARAAGSGARAGARGPWPCPTSASVSVSGGSSGSSAPGAREQRQLVERRRQRARRARRRATARAPQLQRPRRARRRPRCARGRPSARAAGSSERVRAPRSTTGRGQQVGAEHELALGPGRARVARIGQRQVAHDRQARCAGRCATRPRCRGRAACAASRSGARSAAPPGFHTCERSRAVVAEAVAVGLRAHHAAHGAQLEPAHVQLVARARAGDRVEAADVGALVGDARQARVHAPGAARRRGRRCSSSPRWGRRPRPPARGAARRGSPERMKTAKSPPRARRVGGGGARGRAPGSGCASPGRSCRWRTRSRSGVYSPKSSIQPS